ncbi:MAG: HAMP domain-containing histidine kinase [Planctomycetaceae bacterium]|jgi:K+-sensing histidine kinase KdpD|nr:HAMP domain-containing histidine kinase [Planctomycetaceae bacterium]
MTETSADTFFAPAGREDEEALRSLAAGFDHSHLFRAIVDAVPNPVAILNDLRQVVVANCTLLTLLEIEEAEIRGKRPGEILRCIHAGEGPDGCGTGTHCRVCGAVAAILECQQTKTQADNECRLTAQTSAGSKALDLRVTVSPLCLDSREFTLIVLEDIAKEKRLDVLTRTFFHDVLNTAGGIRGFAQLLEEDLPPNTSERDEARQLGSLADKLIDEIECQRDLTRAENGQLVVTPKPVRAAELLAELRTLYSAHEVAAGRKIVLDPSWDGSLLIDPRLLVRVLGNMIKNAVEATPRGGQVVLCCEDMGRQVAFRVSNPTVMPEQVRLQIFQRSFSTKGEPGRGIGTYSIKLFGETYLGGQVSFSSQEPEGTTFTLVVPKVRLDSLGRGA